MFLLIYNPLSQASMFTDAEIRKFMKSFRKFGPPLERLKDIGKNAANCFKLPWKEILFDMWNIVAITNPHN